MSKSNASKKSKKVNKKIYHVDFETTTKEPVSVWLWALVGDDQKQHGNTITSFLDACAKIVLSSNKNDRNEFHFFNLDFDATFIFNWLLRNGYKCNKTIDKSKPDVNEFKLTMLNRQMYNLTLRYKTAIIIFRDSMKYLQGSIASWGKVLGLPKGDTPLLEQTPDKILPEWLDYVYRDVTIAYQAQKVFHEKGLTKNTVAANALAYWKSINPEIWKVWLCDGVRDYRECIDAYKGGITKTNPKYKYQTMYNLKGYDVNSMYPGEMYDNLLPQGRCKEYAGSVWQHSKNKFISNDCCSIIFFDRLKAKAKNPDLLFVSIGEYKTEYDCSCTLSSIDYKLLAETYDIEIEQVERIYHWSSEHCSRDMFKSYIDYWIHVKETTTGVERNIAKLMLNSLYGKFGTKVAQKYYFPYLKNDIVAYELQDNVGDGIYMPIAIFVTAYARFKLYNTMKSIGFDNWVYCDTDSIYSKVEFDSSVVGLKLGQWKLEHDITRAYFTLPKRYKYEYVDNGVTELEVKFAGLSNRYFKDKEWDDIPMIDYTWQREQMLIVKGGKAMIGRTLTV